MRNWDDLRIFRALCGAKSARAAATPLGTTHATISRRIRELENELGGTLFERGRDGYILTEFGKGVEAHAEAVEDSISAIDRLSFGQKGALAGPVRLSVYEDLYVSVLSPHMDSFMAQNPLIELEVILTSSAVDLGRREADVVVRLTRDPPEHLVGRRVGESPMALFTSQAYLQNRPSLDRWVALNYALSEKPMLGARTVFRSTSLTAVAQAICGGQGIGLLPCFMTARFPDLVRLPGHEVIPDMQLWVLTHEDTRTNSRVRALMDHLYFAFSQERAVMEAGLELPSVSR